MNACLILSCFNVELNVLVFEDWKDEGSPHGWTDG